ncbi:MAG: redoxin family protein [Bryobacteraceae bacterium]|nr:redoxin family protein [Bryobacteraceae bacterium]
MRGLLCLAWLLMSGPAVVPGAVVGDAVSGLGSDVRWLQKDPGGTFQKGHVYVVDLWGTWCPPCLAELPKLKALAEKHAGRMTLLAVAVYPESGMPVSQFLKVKGELMPYPVGEDIGERVVKRFDDGLGGLGSGSYPLKAIVDRQGRIAYLGRGYPMAGFDEALRAVLEDRHDVERAAAAHRQAIETRKRLAAVIADADARETARDFDGAAEAYRKLLAEDAGLFALPAGSIYSGMRKAVGKAKANAWAVELLEKRLTGDDARYAWPLAQLAQSIALRPGAGEVAHEDNTAEDFDLAERCARRSIALMKGRDPWRLESLAMVLWARGKRDEARKAMDEAVRVGREEGWGEDEMRKMEGRRGRYAGER